MVAPLIKGARVVTGPSSRTTQKKRPSREITERPSSLNRNEDDRSHTPVARPSQSTPSFGRKQIFRRAILPQTADIEQRVWAFSAAYFILACTLPFYAPQLFFFMFGLAGIGLEAVPVLNMTLPGTEVFLFAWAFTLLIGLGSMGFATVIFSLRGIDAFGGSRGFVFICCTVAYLTLFLSVIPWVAVWALYVAYKHGSNEEE